MELQGILSYIFFLLCLFLITGNFTSMFTIAGNINHHFHTHGQFRPTKLFVFGDSYADTGNNPKLLASSWKPPYGVTFPGKPAGRYSDGRVLTDYLARFMGIRSPLPYKFRKYAPNKLRGGLNFAYGGTGVFDTGNLQPNLTTQIGFLQGLIKDRVYTKRDLKSSLALVAVSGNDYGTYTSTGGSEQGLPSFISQVVNQMAKDLKLIHDIGVRRVLVTTLQPVGCLPTVTVSSSYQQCNESQNSAAAFHNQLLQQAVMRLNNNSKDSSFLILDIFSAFNTVLKSKRDFTGNSKTPLKPCCIATSVDANCGSLDENGKELYTVCKKRASTFFWDTVHPTQAGWHAVYLTLHAAPRCGEFPELQEVREILTSRYGKEFALGAMELRSNCGVNMRMIQKLSPRQSSLETRMKILQEIAAENGVVLKLEDSSPVVKEVEEESTQSVLDDEIAEVLSFSESRKGKKKYRDVEDAAQAAFESAAYAAAAARAAVELSRSRSFSSDNPDSPNSRPRKVLDSNNEKSKLWMENEKTQEGGTSMNNTMVAEDAGGDDSLEKSKVFDESDNEVEDESSDFLSPKQLNIDSGNTESQYGEGLKMHQQLDLTKRPISVRTRRVYGR